MLRTRAAVHAVETIAKIDVAADVCDTSWCSHETERLSITTLEKHFTRQLGGKKKTQQEQTQRQLSVCNTE